MEKNSLTTLSEFIKLYYSGSLVKIAYIKKLPNGKYRVFSEKGKNMGTYNSQQAAKKRLQQIEFFKHKKASDNNILDLSHLDDVSYSSVVRELRKLDKKAAASFISIYKKCFDHLISKNLNDEHVLPLTLMIFNKQYKLSLPKNDT